VGSGDSSPNLRVRSTPLDGVRAFAAFLIVFHHLFFAAGTTSKWKDGVGRFTGRLDVGVPIFFVLSGFLLFRPFFAAILDGRSLPSARTFLTKRFLRIFPAYWIALIVMLCVGAVAVRGPSGFFFSFFLIHIYHPRRAISGITQSWSLATEISFYVTLPLFALLIRRLTWRKSVNQKAIITIVALSVIYVFSLMFRVAVDVLDPSLTKITPYWLASQCDIFALGMFIAVINEWARYNTHIDRFARRVAQNAWLAWLFLLALFALMATQFQLAVGLEVASFLPETLRQFIYGLIGLLMVAPMALRSSGTRLHSAFGWRPFAWVGLISYGVYLWHQFLISGPFALDHMPYKLFDGDVLIRILFVAVSSLMIAALSYYVLEEPLMRAYSRQRPK
jgi:peptidoglycan/LPS O-acetylase OafA/YrhL